jgi:polygalacturonase
MRRIKYLISMALMCIFVTASVYGAEIIYDVRDYGAKPDGKTMCTKSIQKAIDECAKNSGGTVYFPPGTFLSGTIYMKSNVTLRLDTGSTLLGSPSLKDYPPTVQAFRSYTDNYTDKSLIYGEKLKRIAITGDGTIDGQGRAFKGPYKVRPYMIRIIQCQNVMVKDVTIQNSPMWVQHYLACDDVLIDGITVRSRVNANNDGINIDCCHRVLISNCNITSGDDAIVLKSTAARPCRNVTVSNCVLSSLCNGLKMGTESNGGFQNIVMTGCAIYDTRLAGIALEIVDGGTMDRVVVSNIAMNGIGAPIFLRLGNRARPFKKDMEKPKMGAMRNITISNIEATGANPTGCAISGLPGHPIENVTISNTRLSFAGGGTKKDAARAIPEKPTAYPEYSMFGRLPAYGFY